MNRILILINLAVIAFIAGLVTFSALMLQRSTNVARARSINEVIGKINSAQQNMYQVLLSRDVNEVDALSKTIDEEMKNALSQTKTAMSEMAEESRKHISDVADQVPSFSGFKETLKASLLAELDAIDKGRDVVADFVDELTKFLGSNEARSLPQSQLSMFESTTAILRAESEAEFVSARLLFSSALADYVDQKRIEEQQSRRLGEMFENYAKIKEGIFTLRKERNFVISDTVKVLNRMKQGLELAQATMDTAVTSQVDRFLSLFLAVAVVFCLAFVAGLRAVVKKRIVDPILHLQNASQRLASGEFVKVVLPQRDDEIGELAENFNEMAAELQASTRRLEEQNNQLNDIFDNVRSGFCIIDSSCQVQKGFTKACREFLGSDFDSGVSIVKALKMQSRDAGNYQALVEQAFEDDLSTELALAQIPKNFVIGSKNLSIEYRVMRNNFGQIRALLLTIFDVTELSAARALAKRNAELIELASQRATVKRFAETFSALITEARGILEKSQTVVGAQEQLRRILHTLKGNFFSLGLSEMGQFVHEIEDKLVLEKDDFSMIEGRFHGFLHEHRELLRVLPNGDEFDGSIEVNRRTIAQLRSRLRSASETSSRELQKFALAWLDELERQPAGEIFAVAKTTVGALNRKLRKDVVFKFTGQNIRLDPERFRGVAAALPHLINNAMDHGIESKATRSAAGKTEAPCIHLDVAEQQNCLTIRLTDNGAGIDAELLWQKARQIGIVSAIKDFDYTSALQLIFEDKLSSVDRVSSLSGRGIGSAAVKNAVEAVGGRVEVISQRGKGTTIILVFPSEGHLREAA